MKRRIGIWVDEELAEKFRYTADYEGRSMNAQMVRLLRACVEKFEKQHGPILKEDMQAANIREI